MALAEALKKIPPEVVTPNDLIRGMNDTRITESPTFKKQVSWGVFQPDEKWVRTQEAFIPGSLNATDLPMIQPYLFDTAPDVLEQTLDAVTGSHVKDLQSMTIEKLQFGHLAYIFMCRALCNGMPTNFVTYLARGPYERGETEFGGASVSDIAAQDFRNLKALSGIYDRYAGSNLRSKYDVLNPVALGKIEFQGNHYTLFTMPFVPYGELGVEFRRYILKGPPEVEGREPFIRYAMPYNEKLTDTNRFQSKRVDDFIIRKFGKSNEPDIMDRDPGANILRIQMDDLIRGEMVLHLMAGGYFPSHHYINAGDWMGVVSPYGLRMKLITVRGVFIPISADRFINYLLRKQEQGIPDGEKFVKANVLSNYSEERLRELYEEAQRLVVADEI